MEIPAATLSLLSISQPADRGSIGGEDALERPMAGPAATVGWEVIRYHIVVRSPMLQPIRQRKVLVTARFQVCWHCQKVRLLGERVRADEAGRLAGVKRPSEVMGRARGLRGGRGMLRCVVWKRRRGNRDMAIEGALMCG